MFATTVLLVRGDQPVVDVIGNVVTAADGCRFEHVGASADALARLQSGNVGMVLVYLGAERQDALTIGLLSTIHRCWPTIPTLVLSEQLDNEQTLQMLRLGAVECLAAPFNLSRLSFLVDILTVRARYAESTAAQSQPVRSWPTVQDLEGFVVASTAAQKLIKQVRLAAPLDSTILITGETGTGKTVLARLIHRLSARRERPFFAVNCAALSPNLIESEMFGHLRGAFTGADQNRVGKLEKSQDGTLLLDEIDGFPPALQGKLLRAIEEREFEPVGSNESRPLRARLIAASNRVLEEEVAAGRFRADLYFRLNIIGFRVPPLRERREAIPHLTQKYLAEFAAGRHRSQPELSPAAGAALQAYHWPGNVRELRNVIERAVALSTGPIVDLSDLPEAVATCEKRTFRAPNPPCKSPSNGLAEVRFQAERDRLVETLRRNNNNRSHTALDLGISRVALYKKLHKFGLT